MKVAQLIKLLEQFPKSANVVIYDEGINDHVHVIRPYLFPSEKTKKLMRQEGDKVPRTRAVLSTGGRVDE